MQLLPGVEKGGLSMERYFCRDKKDYCDTLNCRSCEFAKGHGVIDGVYANDVLSTLFGESYDLDRLKELVQADREGHVHIGRCLECKHYEGLAECEYLGGCGGSDWICGWFEPKKSALKAMKEREKSETD